MQNADALLGIYQNRLIVVMNDALESRMHRKGASPTRRGAVGNLRQPARRWPHTLW